MSIERRREKRTDASNVGMGFSRLSWKALDTVTGAAMVGRSEEICVITEFVSSVLDSGANGWLLVCGSPGTGKSACVQSVLSAKELAGSSRKVLYALFSWFILVENARLVPATAVPCRQSVRCRIF